MTHRLQLFDSPETLTASVSSFFLDAYASGGDLLIVAKPAHRASVLLALREAGCFPEDIRGQQRLIALDAGEILERITRNGLIDTRLFETVVGPLVARLARRGNLWIYGEIVELLAEQADFAGATRLETLWNRLAERYPFRLFCGYSSAHFTSTDARAALREICLTHNHVSATREDALGHWLLASL